MHAMYIQLADEACDPVMHNRYTYIYIYSGCPLHLFLTDIRTLKSIYSTEKKQQDAVTEKLFQEEVFIV